MGVCRAGHSIARARPVSTLVPVNLDDSRIDKLVTLIKDSFRVRANQDPVYVDVSDNLPRIKIEERRIAVNGLYRHGFLIAPALAELTLGYVAHGRIDNEVMQCA